MSGARDPEWLGLATRVFDACLLLYPAALRRAHGEEMRQVFRDRCREVAAGRRGLARLFLVELLPDTVHSAASAHWDAGIGEQQARHGFALAALVLSLFLLVFQDAFSNRLVEWSYQARYAYFNAQAARAMGEEERRVRLLADALARESSAASNAQAAYLYRILFEGRSAYALAEDSAEKAEMASRALDGKLGEIQRDRESLGLLAADGARATVAVTASSGAGQNGWIAAAAAQSCVSAVGCDRTRAIDRLIALEPDNAYGWSLAFKEASLRGDDGAMRAALQKIGASTHYDDHAGAIRTAIFASARRLLPRDDETRAMIAKRVASSTFFESDDFHNEVPGKCGLGKAWQGPLVWAQAHPESQADCLQMARFLSQSDSPYKAFIGRLLIAERDASPEAELEKERAWSFLGASTQIGGAFQANGTRWHPWTIDQWNGWAALWTPGATEASVVRRQLTRSSP